MLTTLLAVYVLGILSAVAGLYVWFWYGDVQHKRTTLPDHWKPNQ